MIPLALAEQGQTQTIKQVGGGREMRQHLADLGFVAGGGVTIVNRMGGNVIVSVKNVRVAISQEMARKILV